jgi:hypothetical protein
MYFARVKHVLPVVFAVVIPAATGFADTIKLKSGEIIQGKISHSDATSFTIEVPFSATITDERVIQRSDIANVAVTARDEAAYAQIRDIHLPDTALDAQPYETVLDTQLLPFLKHYSYSPFASDVKDKVKAFQAELDRVRSGDVKVAGVWYNKEAYNAATYQISAAIALETMKACNAKLDYVGAMNAFATLLRTYPNSLAFADGLPLGRTIFTKLVQQLSFAISNLPQIQAERQATLDRTPIEQRQPIQQALDADLVKAKALAEAAQKNNQPFFAILPYDENGLKAMQQQAVQLQSQLQTVNETKLTEGSKLVHRIETELTGHELAAARTTFNELQTTWPDYEGLSRLQSKIQSEGDAAAASTDHQEKFLQQGSAAATPAN